MKIKEMLLTDLIPAEYNPRKDLQPEDAEYKKIKRSIEKFGYVETIVFNKKTKQLVGGHQRVKVLKDLGYEKVKVSVVDLDEDEEKALNIALNKITGEWDYDLLTDLLEDIAVSDIDITLTGFDGDELDELIGDLADIDSDDGDFEDEFVEGVAGSLVDKFLVPPFSVLDTRQGYWQNRKRLWLSIGMESELGRDEGLTYGSAEIGEDPSYYTKKNQKEKELGRTLSHEEFKEKYYDGGTMSSTSLFDPVLCEIMYLWFNPTDGKILDPFAGGSVRGVVAGRLGYDYTGVDLSGKQIEANKEQLNTIDGIVKNPTWYNGNSLDIKEIVGEDNKYDLVFSCPPYHDLEVYSDDPADLSNMDYDEFLEAYEKIIARTVSLLKDDRFAIFVVGDVRDKKGFYRNFVGDTSNAFIKAGMTLYNEAVLLNQNASAPLRATRPFEVGRKLTKTHQNVLIFYKGDPQNIRNIYPEINIDETLSELEEEEYGEVL